MRSKEKKPEAFVAYGIERSIISQIIQRVLFIAENIKTTNNQNKYKPITCNSEIQRKILNIYNYFSKYVYLHFLKKKVGYYLCSNMKSFFFIKQYAVSISPCQGICTDSNLSGCKVFWL